MSKKKEWRGAAFGKKPAVIATEIALAMMASQYAYAQATATEERVERIEVTGSRLPSANAEGVSPVTVIDAKDIKLGGMSKPEDILNSLPMVSPDLGSNASNGSNGTANVNLRGIGSNRNLVLVNGRRLPPGSPRNLSSAYAADLNEIPAPLIERVELLTGGASAIYGSDAISGVVNFILKDNFEGLQVDYNRSSYYHNQQNPNGTADAVRARALANPNQFAVPGDVHDEGPINNISVILGANFADNRGNATLFFNYKKENPILQKDYDFSACSIGQAATYQCTGSSTSFPGRFTPFTGPNAGASATVADAAGNTRPFASATDQFNFGPYNFFRVPSEQYGFNAFAHLDVHPNVRAYTEFGFHDNHTLAQIAPGGVFYGQTTFTLTGDNPLLSPSWRNFLGLVNPTDAAQLIIGRRDIEGLPRQQDFRTSSYRFVAGAKGDLPGVLKDWNYDAFFQTAKVLYSSSDLGFFSNTRTARALDVVTNPATGQPACRSAIPDVNGNIVDANCVPYNIFALGQVNPAAINYLQVPGLQNGFTEQRVQGVNFSADLSNYGWKLPTARRGVSVSMGLERRVEQLKLNTDVSLSSFDLSGEGGPNPPQEGKIKVKEYFGEIHVPLIERRPFFYKLSMEGAYRHSSYNTGIKTNTYGISGKYEPVANYRFRASYQRAIRAANIIELFGPQQFNLTALTDPCGPGALSGGGTVATQAQCARSGLTAAQYAASAAGTGLLDNPAGQYNVLAGGNPALVPEEADTYTAGFVLTPLKNLSATIDWWSIKVDKAVGTVPAQTSLNLCVFSGQFCNLISRDPTTGALWLGNGNVSALNQNVGGVLTTGIDLTFDYLLRMGSWGSFNLNGMGTYLSKWEYEPVKGLGKFDCAGLYANTAVCAALGSGIFPKWRHRVRGTWTTPWNVDLAATWRHINAVNAETTSSNPLLSGPTPGTDQRLDRRDYLDLAAVWSINKTFTLRAGVNNVFDKDPPITSFLALGAPFNNGNTYPQVYDALGRLVFVSMTAKF